MKSVPLASSVAALLALLPLASYAARPMITDDARIVDEKSWQVESWQRRNRNSTESWALPSCNFTGNLEITLGGALLHEKGEERTTDMVFQGKTQFRPLESGGWSWGLVVGDLVHAANRKLASGDVYAYIPASFAFNGDRFLLHTNVGWLREKDGGLDHRTWGLGSETQLTERLWLIAEGFGQDRRAAYGQFGLRYWLIPDRLQIDTTAGTRAGGVPGEQWYSIGLRMLSPPFLP